MAANKCTRERECLRCGAMHRRYKFCSVACQRDARRDANGAQKAARLPACDVCGKRVQAANARTCSAECKRHKDMLAKRAKAAALDLPAMRGRALTRWGSAACSGRRSDAQLLRDLFKSRARSAAKRGLQMMTDGTVRIEHVRGASACVYCGVSLSKLNRVVDHMEPISAGGIHSASNVAQACWDCNASKGRKTWREWMNCLSPERREAAESFKRQASLLGSPICWPAMNCDGSLNMMGPSGPV